MRIDLGCIQAIVSQNPSVYFGQIVYSDGYNSISSWRSSAAASFFAFK